MSTATVSITRWSFLAFTYALSGGAAEALAEQDERRSKTRVVGIVGRWIEDQSAHDATIRAEGATAPVTDTVANTIGASLFGTADAAFVANVTAPAAFALAALPDISGMTAGRFKAQFNLVSGASDQTAGLVFDLKPTGEYLFVRYNTREGNMALWRYVDGKREVIARTDNKVQLPLGAWHQITLTISGTRIVGEVNDTLRLEHDLGRVPNGRIGFWTKRDSVTLFRQIVVEPAR